MLNLSAFAILQTHAILPCGTGVLRVVYCVWVGGPRKPVCCTISESESNVMNHDKLKVDSIPAKGPQSPVLLTSSSLRHY